MLGDLAGLCRWLAAWLAFDHNVEVDELVGKGCHIVREAEGVFARGVGGEDVVALLLRFTVQQVLVIRVSDFEVDLESRARLDGKVELVHIRISCGDERHRVWMSRESI